jgi:hypothetical protein
MLMPKIANISAALLNLLKYIIHNDGGLPRHAGIHPVGANSLVGVHQELIGRQTADGQAT